MKFLLIDSHSDASVEEMLDPGLGRDLFARIVIRQGRERKADTDGCVSSNGLRVNIFFAIATGRIPRASIRRRRRNVWHAIPGRAHRLHRRTIRESRARFAAVKPCREYLSCGNKSPSVALRCCNPRGTHVGTFVQYRLTLPN